jgi:hypothetical protein
MVKECIKYKYLLCNSILTSLIKVCQIFISINTNVLQSFHRILLISVVTRFHTCHQGIENHWTVHTLFIPLKKTFILNPIWETCLVQYSGWWNKHVAFYQGTLLSEFNPRSTRIEKSLTVTWREIWSVWYRVC